MRYVLCILLMVAGSCVISCKKDAGDVQDNKEITSLNQSVFYKVVATIPSPVDSAKGMFSDSFSISRVVNKNEQELYSNIPNLSANCSISSPGFSFGYNDPAKSYPCFTFTAYTFPNVPREFILNKAYENSTVPGSFSQNPAFLGYSSGDDVMRYFVDNIFPPDAQFPPLTKTYSNIVFTRKIKVPVKNLPDSALFASGHIIGYCIDYYSDSDTLKYRHKWEFKVDFTDLRIDP